MNPETKYAHSGALSSRPVGKRPYPCNFSVPSDQTDGNLGAHGAISNFRFYKKPLSGERVSQLVASGLQ